MSVKMVALIHPVGDGKWSITLAGPAPDHPEGPFESQRAARSAFRSLTQAMANAKIEVIDHDPHDCDCHEVM